jgi:hypothetical protein
MILANIITYIVFYTESSNLEFFIAVFVCITLNCLGLTTFMITLNHIAGIQFNFE